MRTLKNRSVVSRTMVLFLHPPSACRVLCGVVLVTLLQSGARAADKPVLEYLFDENPGLTIRDASGNGLHARNRGTIDYTAPRWAAGHEVTGMQFDGSGDLVNLGDRDLLDLDRYTIMAWIKYRNAPTTTPFVPLRAEYGKRRNHEIIEKIGAYWLNIRLDTRRLRSGGRFGGPQQDGCRGELPGTSDRVDSSIPVPENRWTHVATTYNGNRLRVFIDGKLVGSKTVATGKCDSDHPAVLGAKYTPRRYKTWPTGYVSNHFNGTIDEFRIYDSALTGTEILGLLGSPGPPMAGGAPGGSVSGMTPRKARCRQGNGIWVTVSRNDAEWLCDAAGLDIDAGDTIRQQLSGPAASSDIEGTVTGMQPRKIKCDNRSAGLKKTRTLSGTIWSCDAAGVEIRKGDEVRVTLIGVAR